MKLLLLSNKSAQILDARGLLAIGGSKSSGIKIADLKHSDDYAVVSLNGKEINAHLLKGKKTGATVLQPLEKTELLDLTLVALPDSEHQSPTAEVDQVSIERIRRMLQVVSQESDPSVVFAEALDLMLSLTQVEKGFIVAKNSNEKFEIVANKEVKANDPWLSETLLTETLKSEEPLFVQNVIGSPFEKNKSLVATGFLSVFTWPLKLKNESFGAFVVGSQRPHSGLNKAQQETALVLSQIAAYALSSLLRDKKLKEQVEALRKIRQQGDLPFVTTSPVLMQTCELAQKVAPTDLSIYVSGETGTGKEVLSRWIHDKSEMSRGPFVAVNCGAIPENLIESVLFGHKKGSFTGAHADQAGKFQVATGGTLFLDEVGDLPPQVQVKLLRALQERVVEPIGSNKPVSVSVRVVCASHKNLSDMVKSGTFREDLYYRLAEVTLEIPPLRERPDDIGLIANQYLAEQKSDKRISVEAWEWLKTQKWSGNVRELLSSIKRAMVLSSGNEIKLIDFKFGVSKATSSQQESTWLGAENLDQAVHLFMMDKVKTALKLSAGNRRVAAELLGITPRTLFRYLEDLRQQDPMALTEMSSDMTV